MRNFLATLAIALVPAAAAAADHQCPDADVSVQGGSLDTAHNICTIASQALKDLAQCHLVQTGPITVEVKPQLDYGHPACLGAFNCAKNRVEILTPQRLKTHFDATNPFWGVPHEDFFASLLVHELTHAVVFQMGLREMPVLAANEYIAYAMQLESLSEENRAVLIDRYHPSQPVLPGDLNDMVLMFSPGLFATRSWLHFNTPVHGCEFISRLLRNQARLSQHKP